ncbi:MULTISPECIES: bifunctional [glutamine synthetase] adenylyltransferase/[glutamine synthetase]-adenylyl-L-tyrosine phosphorylase [Streptomyces]|uniref:Bifunctional glutamine synthetase adenylyltransferase/adenylyl-removing enzyme n=1 Tax=Streptomyces morookaense TaxID=1970 RepID=A0A7Y7B3V2_STRMO|nr:MULTISPECIES: bifunctional [glutamine synthetase] adenylyltransferase/[glutamine synthetase]-adenylyl-L-tyrosine phosphorylase [Streptomyces]MCC2277174.1 bifunctional [glutamine synthetase] adenylyltransferase/[glutamine synthetase]-adenylyl-L-tyrosine phosphorylase [Streptomyces sp. ET3-23]NVK78502.1 bifunctional [glutamine synthetase] adenylyltransferase/[glutamine synthetase]-adenylyl-L-tyrosine phosphorylase [Streptomyces morookaense]GHF32864.1 glutamate-ammonia-ligase adenylyltransferase
MTGLGRRSSTFTRLLRYGFSDAAAAERLLGAPELAAVHSDPVLLDALGAAADPDLALGALVRLVEAQPQADRQALLGTLLASKPLRDRLLGVLGASEALGDHLVRHPGDWQALVTFEASDLHPGVADFERALAGRSEGLCPSDSLRASYRRCLLAIAARDVTGSIDVAQTAAELADLATATLRAALRIACDEHPEDAAACRLAVIGMGKCGGQELNYVSDVDVVFVAEAANGTEEAVALRSATRLASRMMRVCSDVTPEGTIWPVDANLRPEGRNGPLVRTLSSHLAYYQRWAKTWEFQALLKARPVAGDLDLGQAYVDAVSPLVWQAAERDNFVTDVQQMRHRVIASIPVTHVDRELKLGPGGLRDVEFAVQLLQLVHGRSDATLRGTSTLGALSALAAGGYVGRADAASLDSAYRFLRSLEHRIQLYRLRRTHLMPEAEADLRRLGRSLGHRTEPVAELGKEWKRHAREVRRLHEKLFYRPLLDAVAQLEPGETRLSPKAAGQRLEALGYADPAAALRHLEALASGVSRKAAIQRTLLPVLLGWFADSADPDAGLLNFHKVSDALGRTPWYLRLLRDEGAAAENLARVLSAGRLAPDLLLRAPEAVALLGDPGGLRPRGREALEQEVLAAVGRAESAEAAIVAARGVRRRELFRTAAADIIGAYGRTGNGAHATGEHGTGSRGHAETAGSDISARVDLVGNAVSELNAATLAGALRAAVRAEWGDTLPTRFAVIGMGRFGGHEQGYGSDADVLFVHEPREGVSDEEAAKAAFAVAGEMRRLLQLPTTDPPLLVDADLRPEGKSGPMVRSLASYGAYYRRWSLVWESQALLRAEPVAGDPDLGRRFIELVDPLRYPVEGLGEDAVREIRRLKARMESERLPRGADPTTHTKLGRGGLSDVEWTVQLLQMQHGWAEPGLRTTRTREALAAARAAGLVSTDDARILDEAWVLATSVRNAVMLVRGRAGDTFPADPRELGAVARYMGYEPGHVGDMLDDYRRTTRRARAVVEELFYGA